jgi:CsoR family transcriptional regulator, copper-sensing transcriptional repressor
MGKDDEKKKVILRRLKRVEGQIRGITRMVEEDKGCEDVLVQVAAARAALDKVGIHIISHRMKECLQDNGISKEESVEKSIDMFVRYSSNIGPVSNS